MNPIENRKYQPMTQEEFDEIKGLLNNPNRSAYSVAKDTGRGNATVWLIKKAVSFEDYQELRNVYSDNKKVAKSTAQNEPTKRVVATGWKQLDEAAFNRIRDLNALEVPKAQIAKLVNKHSTTIWRVLSATDWADYQLSLRELQQKRVTKPVQAEANVVGEATDIDLAIVVKDFRDSYKRLDEVFVKLGY